MSEEDRERWNARYRAGHGPRGLPDPEVVRWVGTVPPGGRALDVAAGTGRHALWLAERGWIVDAVDVSEVALSELGREAEARGVPDRIHIIWADLDDWSPPPGRYRLVVMAFFVDRPLLDRLDLALKPGGFLFCRSFLEHSPLLAHNPGHAWRPGELGERFAHWRILHLHESAKTALVTLWAQKPPAESGR
ncbi:MAG: class I SAM-dependent methyltransferase [Actinomycetia bacterium]|nr:class I SAM-dependent methyltransferase [Actinomycetes bacterium]